jgi:hypothetical protein
MSANPTPDIASKVCSTISGMARAFSLLQTFAAYALLLLMAGTLPLEGASTFTDANWLAMGGVVGCNGPVYAVVVDDSGNLYIGGDFNWVGDVNAVGVAKWNGKKWAPVGRIITTPVYALGAIGWSVVCRRAFPGWSCSVQWGQLDNVGLGARWV